MTNHERWLIRDFLLHVYVQHRQKFPFQPGEESEARDRHHWLRGFLEEAAVNYSPTPPPQENGTETMGRNNPW